MLVIKSAFLPTFSPFSIASSIEPTSPPTSEPASTPSSEPTVDPTNEPTSTPSPVTSAPVAVEARLSSTGTTIDVILNAAGDTAGTKYPNVCFPFSCFSLYSLAFDTFNIFIFLIAPDLTSVIGTNCFELLSSDTLMLLGSAPICVWRDSSTLSITTGSDPSFQLSDLIVLLGGVVRSADQLSETMARLELKLTPPDPLPAVSAVATAPTDLGLCDSLTLNAGLSTGTAGRPLTFFWQARAEENSDMSTSDLDDLNQLFADLGHTDMLTLDSSPVFGTALQLNLSLTVTNWLNTTDTSHFSVNMADTPLPLVSMASPSLSIRVADELNLQVISTAPATCTASSPSSVPTWTVTYIWQVQSGQGVVLPEAQSRLVVPAYALSGGSEYTIQVTVTYTDPMSGTSTSNSALSMVTVLSSPLVAILTPGTGPQSILWDNLTLSAAESYDPDLVNRSANELSFLWTCARIPSQLSCFLSDNQTVDLTHSELILYPQTDFLSDEFVVSVRVFDSTRNSSAVSTLTFTYLELPELTLTLSSMSLNAHGTHNPQDTLTISAVVEGIASSDVDWAWSWSAALGPAEDLLLTDTTSANLVLAPWALLGGYVYDFNISVSLPTVPDLATTWRIVKVLTNAAPTPGTCKVTLAAEPLEPADVSCSGWTDSAEDLSLQYQFAFARIGSTNYQALTSYQASNTASVILPVGEIDLECRVVDVWGSVAYMNLLVNVPEPDFTEDHEWVGVGSDLLTQANEALIVGDLDIVAQYAAVSLSLASMATAVPLSSASSSVSSTTALGIQLREEVLQLVQEVSNGQPSQDTSELVFSIVAETVSEPSQVTPFLGESALELTSASLDSLSQVGTLTSEASDTIIGTISSVLESIFVSPEVSSSTTTTSSSGESQSPAQASEAVAELTLDVIYQVSAGLASSAVPYQQPTQFQTDRVELQVQVFNNPSDVSLQMTDSSTGSNSSSPSPTTRASATIVSALLPVDSFTTTFFQLTDNIYTDTLASPIIGLTLLDTTGAVLDVNDGEILIQVPLHVGLFEENGTNADTYRLLPCQWWNETAWEWSGQGCEVFEDSFHSIVCNCSHLTSFSSKLVPPVVEPQVDLFFTWDNLMQYPEGFYFLGIYTGFFLILGVCAYNRDRHLDAIGIKKTWEYIQKQAKNFYMDSPKRKKLTLDNTGMLLPVGRRLSNNKPGPFQVLRYSQLQNEKILVAEPGRCDSCLHWFNKRVKLSFLVLWTRYVCILCVCMYILFLSFFLHHCLFTKT